MSICEEKKGFDAGKLNLKCIEKQYESSSMKMWNDTMQMSQTRLSQKLTFTLIQTENKTKKKEEENPNIWMHEWGKKQKTKTTGTKRLVKQSNSEWI